MATKDLILNSVYLKNRVAALGIKQWWLAEQVGVDRKTVIRWLQGKVRAIQPENAAALAKILACQLEDICSRDAADALASLEDQKSAATLLASSSLLEKLGPLGEWNVVESLLRATIVPGLPLAVLGELYIQLTVSCWRQSKIDQAEVFCQKALEVADRCADQQLRASALLSRGNLLSWRGKTRQSKDMFRECLALGAFLPAKTLGSLYSNLGAVLYETGELAEGLACQERAIENFLVHGRPMNLSIAYCHQALIYRHQEEFAQAAAACEQSRIFAEAGGYRRGMLMARLLSAELMARNGSPGAAAAEALAALAAFRALGIEEGLNYEFVGRVHRLAGNYPQAEALLRQGIEIARDFPLYLAALHQELAETLKHAGSPIRAVEKAAKDAIELYLLCEAPLKAAMVRRRMDMDG